MRSFVIAAFTAVILIPILHSGLRAVWPVAIAAVVVAASYGLARIKSAAPAVALDHS
jgi:hypothetical protein